MRAIRILTLIVALTCTGSILSAQSDSVSTIQRAAVYADSFVVAYQQGRIDAYMAMSYPGVIKYYGGPGGFRQHILRSRSAQSTDDNQLPVPLEIIQMINDGHEWQCVVKKTGMSSIDGRKATVISYLVGQSKDEGATWKYFDVSYNSIENIAYIMPDVFAAISVPRRRIIFSKNEMAFQ